MKRSRLGIPRLPPPATAQPHGRPAALTPLFEGPSLEPAAKRVRTEPLQQESRRSDAPLVLPYQTGSINKAKQAILDPQSCQDTFNSRATVTSTRESRDARLKVWLDLAKDANVSGPLTATSVSIVIGALLQAKYRSAYAYFSAAKRHHIQTYKYWDAELVGPTGSTGRGKGVQARTRPAFTSSPSAIAGHWNQSPRRSNNFGYHYRQGHQSRTAVAVRSNRHLEYVQGN